MMMVIVPVLSSRFADVKDPDQRAQGDQREYPDHDKEIHPSGGHRSYCWQWLFHNIKINPRPAISRAPLRAVSGQYITGIHIQPLHAVAERMACQLKAFRRARQVKIVLSQRLGNHFTLYPGQGVVE